MKAIFIMMVVALGSVVDSEASQQSETKKIEEIIERFWVQVADGKIDNDHFSPEQITAYSSGGLWQYISDSEMIASLTTDSRLKVRSHHLITPCFYRGLFFYIPDIRCIYRVFIRPLPCNFRFLSSNK